MQEEVKNKKARLYIYISKNRKVNLPRTELDAVYDWHLLETYTTKRDRLLYDIGFRAIYWLVFLLIWLFSPEGSYIFKSIIVIFCIYNFIHGFRYYSTWSKYYRRKTPKALDEN